MPSSSLHTRTRTHTCSYRAKFIVGSAAALAAKEGGGEAWLLGLRQRSYQEAIEALCTLPGALSCGQAC